MRGLELSPRLMALARQVPEGARLADIGTDHAYLPVWLICQGTVSGAIAADLREGPLERGREVARRWEIPEEQISFRCCDGLAGLSPGEADTIVIAGMGGETIAHIVAESSWAGKPNLLYLFQPMSAVPELRRFLSQEGFTIEEELLVPEEDKLYVIFRVRPGRTRPYTLGEQWLGRQREGQISPLRQRYMDDIISRRTRALEGMRQGAERMEAQIAETEEILRQMIELREEWRSWQR